MRILLVHNHYGSAAPSGENRVFELERDALARAGYVIETFERHSDYLRSQGKIGLIKGALTTPWNFSIYKGVGEVIKRFNPDIVHVHNTFPLISPAVFPAAFGCARVLTLHNYRLVCPAAIPMRSGTPCTECIDRLSVKPSIQHGCYRSSSLATIPLAVNVALHRWRKTWQNDVEAFIALSSFQRDLLVRAGFPTDRIHLKPNFFPGEPKAIPFDSRVSRVVFVGRLGREKGIEDLIDAWLAWGADAPELRIIGDGELRESLIIRSAAAKNIKFLGQLDPKIAEIEISNAKLLVLPSRCFEGFPMVLREAFAFGTPIAVSDQGPLPSFASLADGVVFHSNDPIDLLDKVRPLWFDTQRLEAMALASEVAFNKHFTESKNVETLVAIYEKAIAVAKMSTR